MASDRPAAHVPAEQPQRPPGRLLHDPVRRRHQGADDVDALRAVGHADVSALPHEDVEPDGHGPRVREGVQLLGALLAGGAPGVPHVPFVEADFRLWGTVVRCVWSGSGVGWDGMR